MQTKRLKQLKDPQIRNQNFPTNVAPVVPFLSPSPNIFLGVDVPKIVKELDTDGNGQIDFMEFATVIVADNGVPTLANVSAAGGTPKRRTFSRGCLPPIYGCPPVSLGFHASTVFCFDYEIPVGSGAVCRGFVHDHPPPPKKNYTLHAWYSLACKTRTHQHALRRSEA